MIIAKDGELHPAGHMSLYRMNRNVGIFPDS
jgi:hypothetical protein